MPTFTSSIKRWLPWGAWFGVWAHGCLTIELFGRGVRALDVLVRGMNLKAPAWSQVALDIAPILEHQPIILGLAPLIWSLLLWQLRPSPNCMRPYATWLTLHVLMQCVLIWQACCLGFPCFTFGNLG